MAPPGGNGLARDEPANTAPEPSRQPRTFAGPQSYEEVTPADVDRNMIFTHLPPDEGIVTPIAPFDEQPDPDLAAEIEAVRERLPYWGPGQVEDPVQRARNYLYIPAVADVFQMPVERFLSIDLLWLLMMKRRARMRRTCRSQSRCGYSPFC